MEKLMCKKGFTSLGFEYIEGEMYFYWSNFHGLNHFVSDKEYSENNKNIIVFDDIPIINQMKDRKYLYDYFYTKEEMRDIKINKIIKKC